MQNKHNKELVPIARILRKNMTKEEKLLWYDFLKGYPIKFERQKILGNYIVDFYSAEARLVIELDGAQHNTEEGKQYDEKRTEFLKGYGVRVIRIPNIHVTKNFHKVCVYIDNLVRQSLTR